MKFLTAFGIDPKRYWLLTGLFQKLTERRELLNQLGRDGMSLKSAALLYFVMMGLLSPMLAVALERVSDYLSNSLILTSVMLFAVLISETSNSLVNPLEGLVLAHQPINGATYTAAKLTHLLRILLYFVPGLNAGPALAGLMVKDATWLYPIRHMTVALGIGLPEALFACALFGWLIRFVPAGRLKSAGQLAEMAPFLFVPFSFSVKNLFRRYRIWDLVPAEGPARTGVLIGTGIVATAAVVFGIRSLSGDYLIRVTAIVKGGSGQKAKVRRSWLSDLVARWCGGQGARAGFEYVRRLMFRDWQFRRQLLPAAPGLIGPILFVARGFHTKPFSGQFSEVHLIPHAFGFFLFWLALAIVYGNDHKGAWIFQLAPSGAFRSFARGVWALLWLRFVLTPHVLLLAVLGWAWGIADAAIFVAYSMAVASLYLGLELRLVDGLPFTKQPEPSRAAFMMPLMIVGGFSIAVAVAMQHFLLFRSPVAVIVAAGIVGFAAHLVTRSAFASFEASIRHNLGLLATESGSLYKEVDV